jgi:DNA-binding PadR family transcriptional regulator
MTLWQAMACWFVGLLIVEVVRAWRASRRLRHVLLLVLSGRPHSTLELQQVLGGGVYSALRELEERGVVRRYEDKSAATLQARGGRPRTFYELV